MATSSQHTILAVDDNEAARYSVIRTLQRAGFRTIEAGTGGDALRLLRKNPDLVLLDVRLPDILGFEVCRKIKSDPRTRSLPVIITSASFVGPDARVTGLEGGADAYLAQPISGEELVATVRAVLRTRKAELEAQRHAREAQKARDQLALALTELEENKRTLEAYFEASPLAIVVCNLDGVIIGWNSAAGKMFGWTREEALGRKAAFITQDRETEFAQIRDRVVHERAIVSTETIRRNKAGQELEVAAFYAPVPDHAGNVSAILAKFHDISARRRTEEALRSSDRFAAQGRMAAMLAHEINNPLAAVTNALYLLDQKTNLDVEAGQYLQTATRELARVSHISAQIFGLYRESRKLEQVSIRELLEELLSAYAQTVTARRITIRRQCVTNASVVARRAEIRHLLSNVIANAFDHVPDDGTIWVRVRSRQSWTSPGVSGCSITVADDGPGIAQGQRDLMFDAFFTTKEQRGAGLGLWVAKGIVQRLRGTIRVRCKSGQAHGTCMSLFLPDLDEKAGKHVSS